MEEIKARVMNRMSTEADWLTADPIILKGEIALSIVGNFIKFKIGNGILHYSELSFNVFDPTNLRGAATPSTLPGIPTSPELWVGSAGTYPNFGNVTITGSAGIIVWDGTQWSVVELNIDFDTAINTAVFNSILKKTFKNLMFTNQVFNGASTVSNTSNKVSIPSGQNGNTSLIGVELSGENLFKNIWFKTLNQDIVLEFLVELINIDPSFITADIGGLVGGTITSINRKFISTNIYKIEVLFKTSVKPISIYPFIQKTGSSLGANGSMKLIDVAFYIDDSSSDNLENANSLTLSLLMQEQLQNVTKINVGKSQTPGGIVFDYIGNNAIQQAINAVSSKATLQNQYEIIIHEGVYEALQVSDFTANGGFTFIYVPPFIKLRGVSKDKVIIRGFLPNNLGSSFDYSSYQTVYSHGDVSGVTNCTITSQNILYAIHIDYFTQGLEYYNQNHKNLKIINYGNDGDALGKGGYQALGFGTSQGLNIEFQSVEFRCQGVPLQIHTNANFEKESSVTYKACAFVKSANNVLPQIANVSSLGSRRDDQLYIEGCSFNGGNIFNIDDNNNQNTNIDTADYNAFTCKIYGFGNSPFLLTHNFIGGKSLRIISKAIGGRVEFGITSNAFPALVKDQYFNGGQFVNDLGEIQESGYTYRGSIPGYKGYAIGKLDLSGYQIPNGSMGKRLGNLVSAPLTLVVIVDYISYNVVFNKDYTSFTNQQVLDEITAVVGSVATVDLYSIANDYYPEFTDVVSYGLSSENIYIGNVLSISNGKIKKATSTDRIIVGVALDDIPTGVIGRYIKRGFIDVDYSKRFYALIDDAVTVAKGDRFSISPITPGQLIKNEGDGLFIASDAYVLYFNFD